nr:aminomethyl transferase family protein [Chloroflexota bacterium]
MIRTTPFHSRTSPLCEAQNWRRWAGYFVVGSYELTHEREYWAIRNAAALIDITPLYKYRLTGPDACRLLNRIVTRDVSKCAVGRVMYAPWCDDDGKVIDDGTVSRLDEQTYRLTSADPGLLWLHDNALGLAVTMDDVSDTTAALALQGPSARAILQQLCPAPLEALRYFRLTQTTLAGIPATVSRTGYTGDLGYEIWLDAKDAVSAWDALTVAGDAYGLTPAGILALDIARVEAGLIMIDVDYTSARRAHIAAQKSSPLELGLGWAVDWGKENFIGRKALVEEKRRAPEWRLAGVEVDWVSLEEVYAQVGLHPQVPATAWRTSVPIYVEGVQVGYASSGCWSPILKKYIALAHLRAEHARPGTPVNMEVMVEHQRRQAAAAVAKLPFFDPQRKKA